MSSVQNAQNNSANVIQAKVGKTTGTKVCCETQTKQILIQKIIPPNERSKTPRWIFQALVSGKMVSSVVHCVRLSLMLMNN